MSTHPSLDKILHTDAVNRQLCIFNETFIECLDLCAPIVTKEIKRPYAPWFADELRDTIYKKRMLFIITEEISNKYTLDGAV